MCTSLPENLIYKTEFSMQVTVYLLKNRNFILMY